jgi:TolB-like protein
VSAWRLLRRRFFVATCAFVRVSRDSVAGAGESDSRPTVAVLYFDYTPLMSLRRRTFLVASCAFVCVSAALVSVARVVGAAETDSRPTVAVLYFDYAGKNEDMAVLRKGLAQMLISDLAKEEAIRVVERARLEAVLQEQKLGASGKIDPKTASKVGRLLGARRLVLGGYFDIGSVLRVDARVVDVETGRVLGSVGASSKPDEFLGVEQEVARGLRVVLAKSDPVPSRPPNPQKPVRSPKSTPARPKPPLRLATRTATTYGKALVALDKGNKPEARELLQAVIADQGDFELAAQDLDRLIQ